MTYFIEAVGMNMVKIGFARDPQKRLQQIQTGCPFELKIIATMKGDFEKWLHEAFKGDAIRGEWFRLSADVREFIRLKRFELVCPVCGTEYLGMIEEFFFIPGETCNDESISPFPCAGKLIQRSKLKHVAGLSGE